MIHYLLVRRDLPFGVTLAQLAHAAANSMAAWYDADIGIDYDLNPVDGYCDCSLDRPHWKDMTVVVLGVRNKRVLLSWIRKLNKAKVDHTVIREPDEPWNGDAMAIGVWPGEREDLEEHFTELNTYTEFEGPRELTEVR